MGKILNHLIRNSLYDMDFQIPRGYWNSEKNI